MFSDTICEMIHNIIDSFVENDNYTMNFYNETVNILMNLYHLLAKLDGNDTRCNLYISKLIAKNSIDEALFKRYNCECESFEYCEICEKYDKNIDDYEIHTINSN